MSTTTPATDRAFDRAEGVSTVSGVEEELALQDGLRLRGADDALADRQGAPVGLVAMGGDDDLGAVLDGARKG